jgi:prepilin peptidase CpaA
MLGAGDIKLFCAIGAIMGAKFALWSIAFSFIAGGFIGAIIMIFRKNALLRFKCLLNYIKTCFLTLSLSPYGDFDGNSAGAKFPYACAAALGAAIAGVFARIYSSSFLQ